ncbi:MAG TPA: hypothetical protein VFD73_02305, partial [Gemmatimonadales bacterium]|nr:hypothetical protein [Gemmatimonadales bacterium]
MTDRDPPLERGSGSSGIDGMATMVQASSELLDEGTGAATGRHQDGCRVQEHYVADRAGPSLENLMNDAGVV